MKVFDANHVLRFILQDNAEMADHVEALLDAYSVYVPYEVLAEVCYVLTKVYGIERKEAAAAIDAFLSVDGVKTDHANVMTRCLELYSRSSLDFVDCLLCAYHTELGYEICTFDKKLLRMIRMLDEA